MNEVQKENTSAAPMEGMGGHDLTRGPIGRTLWSLAWPTMLSIFFYTLYNMVDAYWVSKLSSEAIAAVSISQITLIIMMSLGFGITAGSGVIMGMDIGAKNTAGAERILGQSFVLSAILGVFFTAFSLFFRNELLTLSGASGAVFEPAREYFTVTAAGSILMFIMASVIFAFNSQGETHTLTKFFAISTLANCILDPIMIFGWGGFPAMGIAGAAIATLISQAIFLAIAIYSLMRPHRNIRFHLYNLTLRWESVKKVMNIGFPAAITQVIFPIGLALLTFIVSRSFLEAGTVAFSLGFRIEFFAYLPAVGFGFAGMAMMSQNIGAGNTGRAKEVFQKALVCAFFAALGLGVLVALFAGPIISAFTSDPVVTGYARTYMWTVALSYGFLAAVLVEAPAFQAIGRSWPGFWIFFLRVMVVTLPLTVLFTKLNWPITGVWAAIVAGNVVASVVGYMWITRALKKAHAPEGLTKT